MPILSVRPLGFVWETADPFLFCVHHEDAYPAGDGRLGPAASLAGRDLGQDFAGRDGWRMYHGERVPGFPAHPHRGFETVTIVRKGLVDHADSLGAAARYGEGDVQWLTAGAGVVHAEMFPLTRTDAPNTMELFQIWLNLPAADKMAPPHFTMAWGPELGRVVAGGASITLVAGALSEVQAPPPPPRSWASRPDADVAIWNITLAAGATWTLPAAQVGTNRTLYLFEGAARVAGRPFDAKVGVRLRPDAAVELTSAAGAQLLLLQGRPIGEPVVAHGPFVMNSTAEIQQAFADYRRTRFGGWPWPDPAPTHGAPPERFARRPDGSVERPG